MQGEKPSIYRLKTETSEENKPADTSTLDLEPPELWES
jgi:hypothetical protein